jgi:hypothetical protein
VEAVENALAAPRGIHENEGGPVERTVAVRADGAVAARGSSAPGCRHGQRSTGEQDKPSDHGATGLKAAPSAWSRVRHGALRLHVVVRPPQTISSRPVQTAVGSTRPGRGDRGSGDQRFPIGS